MKNKIGIILDGIFSFILFFCVLIAIFKKLSAQNLYLLTLASTLLCQVVYLGASEKNKRASKGEIDMLNTFIFTSASATDCTMNALRKYSPKKVGNYIVLDNLCVFVSVSHSTFSYGALCDAYRQRPKNVLLIICNLAHKDAKSTAMRLPTPVYLWERDKLYSLLSTFNSLPSPVFSFRKKRSLTKAISYSSTTLSLKYLVSSAVLLLFSTFSPFATHYLFFALLLFSIAIIPPLIKTIIKN